MDVRALKMLERPELQLKLDEGNETIRNCFFEELGFFLLNLTRKFIQLSTSPSCTILVNSPTLRPN